VSSTYTREAPIVNRFVDLSICRIEQDDFYYVGKVNDKKCSFKIDTGSDISVLNKKLVDRNIKKIRIKKSEVPDGRKGISGISG